VRAREGGERGGEREIGYRSLTSKSDKPIKTHLHRERERKKERERE